VEDESALFCRSTQQSFLRLLTNRSVFSPYGASPLTGEQAWATYDQLAMDARVGFDPNEPSTLGVAWRRFTFRPLSSPKLWMDAYLAAFAVSGGFTFVTTDSGFRQFEGLDVVVLGS
jgi:toxin-antitoxin system PIN domain toxin